MSRRTLTSGSARAVDGYDVINQQFFAGDLENEQVVRRLAEAVADQVMLQLADYFDAHAQVRPGRKAGRTTGIDPARGIAVKSDARRLPQLVRALSGLRVICLYGDDSETIRDCARRLVIAEAGSADDPFRVSECDGERARGDRIRPSPRRRCPVGARWCWVRHATERVLPAVERTLDRRPRARRRAADPGIRARPPANRGCASGWSRAPRAAWSPATCRPRRPAAIRAAELEACEVSATPEVVGLLAAHAEAAECPARGMGLPAALYAGRGGRLDAADVAELGGAAGADGMEAGLNEGLCGGGAALDGAISAALAEGEAIAVLRSALLHLQRLRAVAVLVAEGRTMAEAARAVRPPVFFRQEKSTALTLRSWNAEQLGAAARAVWKAERRQQDGRRPARRRSAGKCWPAWRAPGRGARPSGAAEQGDQAVELVEAAILDGDAGPCRRGRRC